MGKKAKTPAQQLKLKERRKAAKARKRANKQQQGGAIAAVKQEVKHLKKQVAVVKKRTDGPKVQESITATLDLGMVKPSATEGLTKQLTLLTNPLYLKTPTPDATSTPFTTKAAMYQMWRVASFRLEWEPLVGNSAVAGTVCLATVVKDAGDTGQVSVDNVYTRTHCKMHVGKPDSWKVPSDALRGPADGWYYTDPQKEQTATMGSLIELWTYGQTRSTYQNAAWDGPLFRILARVTYEFTSFDHKPELSNLEKTTPESVQIEASTDSSGDAVCRITKDGLSAGPRPGMTANTSAKDLIWAVSDAVVGVLGAIPGWGWLIQGGWWFIKKLVGRQFRQWLVDNPGYAGNGQIDIYHIYDSFDAARNDHPWKPPTQSQAKTWQSNASFIQLTPEARDIPLSYPLPDGSPMAPMLAPGITDYSLNVKTITATKPTVGNGSNDATWNDVTFVGTVWADQLAAGNWSKALFWGLAEAYPGDDPTEWARGSVISSGANYTVEGDVLSLFHRMRSSLASGACDPGFKIGTLSMGVFKTRSEVRCVGIPMSIAFPFWNGAKAVVPAFLGCASGISSGPPAGAVTWQLREQATYMFLWVRNQNAPDSMWGNQDAVNNAFYSAAQPPMSYAYSFTFLRYGAAYSTVDGRLAEDTEEEDDETCMAISPGVMRRCETSLVDAWRQLDGWGNYPMGQCVMCRHCVAHCLEMCVFMRFKTSRPTMTAKESPFERLLDRFNPELDERETWTFELERVITQYQDSVI